MTEAVRHNVCERERIDDLLVCRNGCGDVRNAKTRRRRVAAKHWVRPIYPCVNDSYVDSLPLVSVRVDGELCKVVRILSIDFGRADVVNALNKVWMKNAVRVNFLHLRHGRNC